MKAILLSLATLSLVGCAAGSPIDFLIPTPRPSVATEEYLGHLYYTNDVNRMYHSLSDTKIEKALVPIRKMELQGLFLAAKGETEIIEQMGSKVSNGLWVGVMALAGLAGWQLPSPREKGNVTAALHKQPPTTN